jgi:hypothetical protein
MNFSYDKSFFLYYKDKTSAICAEDEKYVQNWDENMERKANWKTCK